MEWSKAKTMKLIELMQVNPNLWNPSLCDSRKEKQKRRAELRHIAEVLGTNTAEATKKIQHLRTQYNREWAREVRANVETPDETYISGWYAYEYIHFLKDSNKPYRILQTEDNTEENTITSHTEINDYKLELSPARKIQRTDSSHSNKTESNNCKSRDEFSIFGEYIANELRSLKTEQNQTTAKKKILDVIFEVKMNSSCDSSRDRTVCTVYDSQQHSNAIHSDKEPLRFTTQTLNTAHIEPLTPTHTTPTSGISEIIINSACHYSNFKVDTQ